MTPPTAQALGLVRHPEGGWYRRIYASPHTVPHPVHGGPRPAATLIHYLLAPGEQSAWHAVASDEIWLWHSGGPLELHIRPPGTGAAEETVHRLGPGIESGETLHQLVPADHWQRAEPAGDREVLVSCLVTPGFDFADFTLLDDPGDEP